MLTTLVAAAGAGSGNVDPFTILLGAGVAGAIVVCFITGLVFSKSSMDKATERAEKAEAQRDAMALILQDKVIPVIGEFISTTKVFLPLLEALAAILPDVLRSRGGDDVARQPRRAPGH